MMQISLQIDLNDDDEISTFLRNVSLINGIVKKTDLVDMIIKERNVKDAVKVDDKTKSPFPPVGTPVTTENFVKGMLCYFTDTTSDFEEYSKFSFKVIRPIYGIKDLGHFKYVSGAYENKVIVPTNSWRYCFVADQKSTDI